VSERQNPTGGQARLERADDLRASPPLFSSPTLDRLTRVHPAVPVLLYGPVVVALVAWALAGGVGWALVPLLAAGYVLWTLTEYWLHRVVFHFEPDHGIGLRLHYLIHGVHHDHPNDPRRLVMPPSASVPLATGFGLIFYGVFSAPTWQAVAAGFIAGYVAYDTLHYLVHHRVPRSRIGRALRERHMRHHFQDDTRGFGVSAPYWDAVFGTAVRVRSGWREAFSGWREALRLR
jgi:sterol desaturase/sphingolipid hydroxylase (fatty acid hydroxylase superfamily)